MFLAYFPPSKQSRKTDFYTVIEQDFAGNHLGAKRKEGRKEGRKKGRKEGRLVHTVQGPASMCNRTP